MRFGTNYSDTVNLFYLEFHALSQTWKALQRSKVRIPSGVVVLKLKLSRGFCSDDFAETWRVMIRVYYKLIVEF